MRNIILFTLSLLAISCIGPEPEDRTSKYIITNNSVLDVKLVPYGATDTIAIASNTSTTLPNINGVERTMPFNIDTLLVIFEHHLPIKYTFQTKSPYNLMFENNYTSKNIGENNYEFYYTITDEDYSDAEPIE